MTHPPAVLSRLVLILGICTATLYGAEQDLRQGIAAATVETGDDRSYAQVELIATVPPRGGLPGHVAAMRRSYHEYFRFPMRGQDINVSHPVSLLTPPEPLTLKDGKLSGNILLAPVHRIRGVMSGKVDAFVTGERIEGTLRFRPTWYDKSEVEAPLIGRIIPETALVASNAVSPDHHWPYFFGPLAGFSSATASGPLLTDPTQFKLVWKSEASDIGRGMGNTANGTTAFWGSRDRRTPSGSSSPILADGKVYLSYTRPTPRPEGAPNTPIPGGGGTQDQAQQRMVTDAKVASVDDLPLYAKEKTYSYHDHIMLCMDAASGKTLWKTIVEARSIGFNMTHKYWGAYNMTPAYSDGKVFATSTSGWVYAYDADNGKPLWERKLWEPPTWGRKTHISFQTALLAFDDKLIVPQKTWTCLNAANGEVLWSSKTQVHASVPILWTHRGERYLLVMSSRGGNIDCIRAGDGQQIWRLPTAVWSGGKVVGPGGLSVSGDTLLVNRETEAGPTLAAYRLGLESPEMMWELPDAKKPERGKWVAHPVHRETVTVAPLGRFAFTADLRVFDITTGKQVNQTQGVLPINGGYMQAMGNLVMTRQDGTHGHITAGFYQLDETGKVIAASAPWNHGDGLAAPLIAEPAGKFVRYNLDLHTTSYHHPLHYPMADGRIFIRGGDGIYCWDLRKK